MEKKENYTIELNDERGEIIISDEVIAVIAGLAAIEVDGVASMAGDITKDLIGKLGKKATSKGVKVDVLENVAKVVVSLNIKYGYNVMEVSEKVQDKVKVAVENMTGLTVSDVNIRVAGVAVEE
ncbi:MAG: Asp23/Gls24 family envelope stress response protein [Faecalimonas sp.]|nr:Asp23/Gls24 family envelope stress response protein [Faecalimonas sp.]